MVAYYLLISYTYRELIKKGFIMDELIEYFGTQAEVARRLKVDPAAVSQWGNNGIPPRRAIQIELITDGEIKAIDLIGGYSHDNG